MTYRPNHSHPEGTAQHGLLNEQAHAAAVRWLDSMQWVWGYDMRKWETDRPTWRTKRALDAGVDEWAQGDRLELIHSAACRVEPDRRAFVTLALQHWTDDFLHDENFWLLPYQLAWVWAGVELDENGLPAGIGINDLPLPVKDRTREAAPGEGTASKAQLGGEGARGSVANAAA